MTLRDALLRGKKRPRSFGSGSPTTYRGDGYEFVELRAYVPGDDVRRIDWAATARASALQTRVVLEDVALTLAAIVDDSPSMRVGRRRALLDAANEAVEAWFNAASGDDRCIRVGPRYLFPPRGARGRVSARAASLSPGIPFDAIDALRTARAALQRGSALLAIGDWYELNDTHDALLSEMGMRFDCTALVARDPWYGGLPLRGMVRLRGAEGGNVRAYIGRRERTRYREAVREREARVLARFERTNWRVGILHEDDGSASLAEAFGLHAAEVAVR